MVVDVQALTVRHRLTNRRGAVLLLAIYFASLLLLILGGVSLQRTTIESRSAQLSRDAQQAFFLAEGTLDFALAKLKTDNLGDHVYTPTNMPGMQSGTSFTITTKNTEVVDPQTQQITREIIATGTTKSGRSAQVKGTVTQQGPLKGVWSEGPLWVKGAGVGGTGAFTGDLRSSLGILEAIKLTSNVQHKGQLQIAPSAPVPAGVFYNDVIPGHENTPWVNSIGNSPPPVWQTEQPGVYLQTSLGHSPSSKPCSTCQPVVAPAVAPMVPGQPIDSPYLAGQCSSNITTLPGQTLTIADGSVNPPDLSPPNDGKIVLCLNYLQSDAAGAKVIFQAPTTLYITGKNATGFAVKANDIYAVPPGFIVPDIAPLTPSGLKLIITKTLDGTAAGAVHLRTKRFAGSIYAPKSTVFFTATPNSEYRLENIVARETELLTFGVPISIDKNPASAATPATTVTLKSWSSD